MEDPLVSILRKGCLVLIPKTSSVFMDLDKPFYLHFAAVSRGVFGASPPWRGRISQAEMRGQ